PAGHARLRQMAAVVLEDPCGGWDVAGLEQTDDHGQQREAAWIFVGPSDQPEDLDLGFHRRAEVGEHVYPVVLSQQRRGAARETRKDEAARPVEAEDRLAEGA